MNRTTYESPLNSRYASKEMQYIFSPDRKFTTWRRLWVALAESEMELGLPVTQAQVDELKAHIEDIDYEAARRHEERVRHDVMAHVHAYGDVCPNARGIIHLGATSCYVTDNADILMLRDALTLIREKLVEVLRRLRRFAWEYKGLPCLGYTHLQPAQLTTIGKRATLWMQDLLSDLDELEELSGSLRFLGCRGATGTEASLLDLFDGDGVKVDELNRRLADVFGFRECFAVCGQTYPRKVDSRILNLLSSLGQSCHKMATDIRLLQHDRQLEEPFGSQQIGSSAMAYKRNPMRCERICSLSRYLISDAVSGAMTASTQWLERTLDDSAGRRISLPEGFLCADAILRLAQNVVSGLSVNERIIEGTVQEYLPFVATEDLLMEAVKRGGDRQTLHETIRTCSMEAAARMKAEGVLDLSERIAARPEFGMTRAELDALLQPDRYIGRCREQVERFLEQVKPRLAGAGEADADIPV